MMSLFGKSRSASQPKPTEAEYDLVDEDPDIMDEIKLNGWVSPSYTVSRPVILDPNITRKNRCVACHGDSPYMEQYRVLRSRILHRTDNSSGKIVMITSTAPGEGKSLTAINLAFTFAREYNYTTLLADCDLRRQSIHKILGYAGDKGLADCLKGRCGLSDVIVWPDVEKLTIISGGKTVGDSSELLGSKRMRQLVLEMRERYDDRYIFLDAPPVLTGADTMTLAPLVDHILFVVQAGRTQLSEIRQALGLLPKEKIIGLVLNRQPAGQTAPYYSGYQGSSKT
jgi:protein-tyrosine kinase